MYPLLSNIIFINEVVDHSVDSVNVTSKRHASLREVTEFMRKNTFEFTYTDTVSHWKLHGCTSSLSQVDLKNLY